jgi:hypothetical protein
MSYFISIAICAVEGAILRGIASGLTEDHETIKALYECRDMLRKAWG